MNGRRDDVELGEGWESEKGWRDEGRRVRNSRPAGEDIIGYLYTDRWVLHLYLGLHRPVRLEGELRIRAFLLMPEPEARGWLAAKVEECDD